ncbi:MAG: tetratricopeptide repeat protein [Promethearchaeota archaeon]
MGRIRDYIIEIVVIVLLLCSGSFLLHFSEIGGFQGSALQFWIRLIGVGLMTIGLMIVVGTLFAACDKIQKGSKIESKPPKPSHEIAAPLDTTTIELEREVTPEANMWNEKGLELLRKGKLHDALVAFNRAIQIQPEFPLPWLNRGVTLRQLKRYQEALESYERALQLKPEFASIWFNIGNVLLDLGRPDEAQEAYRRTIQLDPNHQKARKAYHELMESLQKKSKNG